MIDKSISFGQQNFLFVDCSEVDGTYDYAAYMTTKGSILMARFNKAGDNGRYCLTSGVYATIWTNRATLTYVLPDALVCPSV